MAAAKDNTSTTTNGYGNRDNSDEPTPPVISKSTAAVTVSSKPWIDKGWAWVVAFGGMFVMFAAIGQMRCLGLYFAELQKLFKKGSTISAILPSILFTLAPMMCVVSSALASWYGTRPVVVVGIVCAVTAHLLTMFAQDITQFLVLYTGLAGVGIGLIYTPTQILVARYFVKHSSLAQGIVNTGSSLAGISLPYLFSFLVDYYGFRGTMVILGGIIANTLIAAMLFRPFEFWEPQVNGPAICKDGSSINEVTRDDINNEDVETQHSLEKDEKQALVSTHNGDANSRIGELRKRKHSTGSEIELETTYNLAPTGSMIILGESLTVSQQDLEQLQQLSPEDGGEESCHRSCCRKLKTVINFSLLKSPAFVVHTICSSLGFTVYMLMSMILPSHAIDLGIEKDKAYMLLSIGTIAEAPSRILITFLADRWATTKYGQKFHFMSVCVLVSGVLSIVIGYCTTYVQLAVYYSINTFLMGGGFLALNVDVLREAIGLERLSNGGLGLSLFFTGITSGMTPVVVGAMRDRFGNYVGAFNLLGGCGFIAGSVLWFQLFIQRRHKQQLENQHKDVEL